MSSTRSCAKRVSLIDTTFFEEQRPPLKFIFAHNDYMKINLNYIDL